MWRYSYPISTSKNNSFSNCIWCGKVFYLMTQLEIVTLGTGNHWVNVLTMFWSHFWHMQCCCGTKKPASFLSAANFAADRHVFSCPRSVSFPHSPVVYIWEVPLPARGRPSSVSCPQPSDEVRSPPPAYGFYEGDRDHQTSVTEMWNDELHHRRAWYLYTSHLLLHTVPRVCNFAIFEGFACHWLEMFISH